MTEEYLLNAYSEFISDCRKMYNDVDLTINQVLNNIRWAHISYNNKSVYLKSNRVKQDENRFVEFLKNTDYDPGFGGQELFGVVVFNDDSWLERQEYDGSEWWEHKRTPKEPNWKEII